MFGRCFILQGFTLCTFRSLHGVSVSASCQALDGEMGGVGGLDASPKAPSAPLVDAQLPFATYSEHVESVGLQLADTSDTF